MVLMVALNTSAGLSGQVLGRMVHYKRLPTGSAWRSRSRRCWCMGWNAQSLTPGRSSLLLADAGLGFGPMPPLARWRCRTRSTRHQLGIAVGTMSFLRNLCATMMVAMFGAHVLVRVGAGRCRARRRAGLALTGGAVRRMFYVAAASMVVSLVALLLMEEKPLRSNRPAAKGSPGGDGRG